MRAHVYRFLIHEFAVLVPLAPWKLHAVYGEPITVPLASSWLGDVMNSR